MIYSFIQTINLSFCEYQICTHRRVIVSHPPGIFGKEVTAYHYRRLIYLNGAQGCVNGQTLTIFYWNFNLYFQRSGLEFKYVVAFDVILSNHAWYPNYHNMLVICCIWRVAQMCPGRCQCALQLACNRPENSVFPKFKMQLYCQKCHTHASIREFFIDDLVLHYFIPKFVGSVDCTSTTVPENLKFLRWYSFMHFLSPLLMMSRFSIQTI